jgi:hypothetical protein
LGFVQWRNHQPDIGRFFNIDPLADKYVHSPYAFSENRVIDGVELEGLEWAAVNPSEANWEFLNQQQKTATIEKEFNNRISTPQNFVIFPSSLRTNDVNVEYGGESAMDHAQFLREENTILLFESGVSELEQGISVLLHESQHDVSFDEGAFPDTGDSVVELFEEVIDGVKVQGVSTAPGVDTSKDEIKSYNTQLIGDYTGLVNRTPEQIKESVDQRQQYENTLRNAQKQNNKN